MWWVGPKTLGCHVDTENGFGGQKQLNCGVLHLYDIHIPHSSNQIHLKSQSKRMAVVITHIPTIPTSQFLHIYLSLSLLFCWKTRMATLQSQLAFSSPVSQCTHQPRSLPGTPFVFCNYYSITSEGK